jgi:hypothetical protein
MTMYLLLRNNKQSGPYSLEDLKNMGMKPYDLVWLEGKSAAWRYPSEIDELKEFAPAVEEQPFDRFYKKPGGTTTATTATGATAASNAGNEATIVAFRPVTESCSPGELSTATGKRIIYVTLPSGRPAPMPMRESPVRESPVREIPREVERARPEVAGPSMPVSVVRAVGDFSSLPDRQDKPPVEFAPRNRSHRNERLLRLAGVGVCILALLSAGIFIGLSMNRQTPGQKRIASAPSSVAKQAGAAVQPAGLPAANAVAPVNTAGRTTTPVSDNAVASTVNDNTRLTNGTATPASAPARKIRKQKEKIPAALMPPIQKDTVLAEVPVVKREAVHRPDAEPSSTADNKQTAKTAITSEVSVGANGYSVGTFGGINGLQLTVTNRSTYPLDLVVVEVQYIQANKKVYKTENLYFRGIGPGAALMQEAPKSSRGIRVLYKITSISSKELGLSYSGL